MCGGVWREVRLRSSEPNVEPGLRLVALRNATGSQRLVNAANGVRGQLSLPPLDAQKTSRLAGMMGVGLGIHWFCSCRRLEMGAAWAATRRVLRHGRSSRLERESVPPLNLLLFLPYCQFSSAESVASALTIPPIVGVEPLRRYFAGSFES